MHNASRSKAVNMSGGEAAIRLSTIAQFITAVASALIVIQVWIAHDALKIGQGTLRHNYEALQQNHELNRRHYASEMMKDWNDNAGKHKDAILKEFPDLLDKKNTKPLSREKALAIYGAIYGNDAKDKELFELRNHIIAMFNYFEYIASAYFNGVADQLMIEETFDGVIKLWYNYFKAFIDVAEEKVGFRPWQPINDLIIHWEAKKNKPPRRNTGE